MKIVYNKSYGRKYIFFLDFDDRIIFEDPKARGLGNKFDFNTRSSFSNFFTKTTEIAKDVFFTEWVEER